MTDFLIPFHTLRLVKSLPFHIPEAGKRYPFLAESSRIGHYRECPPPREIKYVAEGIRQSKLNLKKIFQALQQAFFLSGMHFELESFSSAGPSPHSSWVIGNPLLSRTLPNEISEFLTGCHEVSPWHHKQNTNVTELSFTLTTIKKVSF